MCGATKRRQADAAFVKLLETGVGPVAGGIFRRTGAGMTRRRQSTIGRAGALLLAAALLSPEAAVAQSDGVSNFLNNLFKPGNNAQQPQAPGPGGAPAW